MLVELQSSILRVGGNDEGNSVKEFFEQSSIVRVDGNADNCLKLLDEQLSLVSVGGKVNCDSRLFEQFNVFNVDGQF